jgi:hypothetical protein
VLDDQPQPAAAQLMRFEGAAMSAAATQFPITGTIDTLTTYGVVMGFDFGYSRVARQFDTNGKNSLDGGAGVGRKRASLLHFSCAQPLPDRKKGAGF